MIRNREIAVAEIELINVGVIANGDYALAYRNMCNLLEKRFEIALLRWRRGESPVPELEAALVASRKMLAAIESWKLEDETVNGYGDIWNVVRFISLLLNQPAALLPYRLDRVRENRSQYADLALEYNLLDALEGGDWSAAKVSDLSAHVRSSKRQALVAQTYNTYFDLLHWDGRSKEANVLVQSAESNFNRRARDAFYSGGPTYMGGGPDNPYVVDFALAAVLKQVGWGGDSVHKWKW